MIKKIFDEIKNIAKKLYKLYPVTMTVIILGTVVVSFGIDSIVDSDFIVRLISFLFFLFLGSFFSEIFFPKIKIRCIIYGISLILSILFTYWIFSNSVILNTIAFKVCLSYSIIMLILCFYKLYKNSHNRLGTYLVKVYSSLLKTGIIYGILSTGLMSVSVIFSLLFLQEGGFDIIFRVQMLLLGFFYVPGIIRAFRNYDEKTSEFFLELLIRYIMESIVILAFMVIYLYMLKIVITGEIPSNQIFRILSILFIFSLPIWTLNQHYNDKNILTKINDFLPIAFIPFIFLEIYSISTRIINFGITNIRYIGMIVLMFQIIYLLIYIFKKEKIDWCFYFAIGLVVISFLLPRYNMIDLSNISQTNRIKKYLAKEELTIDEKKKLVSSYNYVKDNFNGEEYLNNELSALKDKINDLIKDDTLNDDFYYVNKEYHEKINIDGYKTLDEFEADWYGDIYKLKAIISYDGRDIDVTDVIKDYIDNRAKMDEYVDLHHEIVIDQYKIVFTSIFINYDVDEMRIISSHIKGIILEE